MYELKPKLRKAIIALANDLPKRAWEVPQKYTKEGLSRAIHQALDSQPLPIWTPSPHISRLVCGEGTQNVHPDLAKSPVEWAAQYGMGPDMRPMVQWHLNDEGALVVERGLVLTVAYGTGQGNGPSFWDFVYDFEGEFLETRIWSHGPPDS